VVCGHSGSNSCILCALIVTFVGCYSVDYNQWIFNEITRWIPVHCSVDINLLPCTVSVCTVFPVHIVTMACVARQTDSLSTVKLDCFWTQQNGKHNTVMTELNLYDNKQILSMHTIFIITIVHYYLLTLGLCCLETKVHIWSSDMLMLSEMLYAKIQ